MNMKMRFFLISGVCIGLVLKIFVFDIARVHGSSMEPAVHENSLVFINKSAYGLARPFGSSLLVQWAQPEKGDVILFIYKGKAVIKRCAACAGEALDFSSDSGYSVSVGGKTYPLTEKQYRRIKFDTVVPERTVMAIGDNYADSVDSRDYGFIPVTHILGKVVGK